MKKGLVLTNVIVAALLVAEIALLACGHNIIACILSGAAVVVSVILFIINRGGELAIAMISCVGYALAIIGGLAIEAIFPGQAVNFGLLIGGMTLVMQAVLTLTRSEGRM